MPYMSYCRFEGTHTELSRCIIDLDLDKSLSKTEENYSKGIYKLCKEYIRAYEEYNERRKEEKE